MCTHTHNSLLHLGGGLHTNFRLKMCHHFILVGCERSSLWFTACSEIFFHFLDYSSLLSSFQNGGPYDSTSSVLLVLPCWRFTYFKSTKPKKKDHSQRDIEFRSAENKRMSFIQMFLKVSFYRSYKWSENYHNNNSQREKRRILNILIVSLKWVVCQCWSIFFIQYSETFSVYAEKI